MGLGLFFLPRVRVKIGLNEIIPSEQDIISCTAQTTEYIICYVNCDFLSSHFQTKTALNCDSLEFKCVS